ncbi:MAG TPA: hypothetical protein VFX28_19600 [Methylomirabilota bacterium]|nr:hypothetical protein [Methylomirabilota bacterium]
MRRGLVLLSAVAVLTVSSPAAGDECADLAQAFSQNADAMSSRELATLRRCVDDRLQGKLGLGSGTPARKAGPVPPLRQADPARNQGQAPSVTVPAPSRAR